MLIFAINMLLRHALWSIYFLCVFNCYKKLINQTQPPYDRLLQNPSTNSFY